MFEKQLIEAAAQAASKLTRQKYNEKNFHKVMCYDLARQSAVDRDLPLCRNVDVDDRPDNVGSALLKMFDELRGENKYAALYEPRLIVTGG